MDGLVRRLAAEGVEGRQRGRLRHAPQHVGSRALARVPHILGARRAQQFRDQFQLQKGVRVRARVYNAVIFEGDVGGGGGGAARTRTEERFRKQFYEGHERKTNRASD